MEEKNNRTKNNKIYASELDFDVVRRHMSHHHHEHYDGLRKRPGRISPVKTVILKRGGVPRCEVCRQQASKRQGRKSQGAFYAILGCTTPRTPKKARLNVNVQNNFPATSNPNLEIRNQPPPPHINHSP